MSALLVTRRCAGSRYSGFGIAYHKYALFQAGGRPVLYGCTSMLGKRIKPDEPGYEEGKEIYAGSLPVYLGQYSGMFKPETPISALVVEKDEQVDKVRTFLQAKAAQGVA